MLDLMLGNNRKAFSCGEIHSRFRPHRRHQREGFRTTVTPPEVARIRCSCRRQPCPVWEKLSDQPEHEFHLGVFDRLGVTVVADSSKRLSWVLDAHRRRPASYKYSTCSYGKSPGSLHIHTGGDSATSESGGPALSGITGATSGSACPFGPFRITTWLRTHRAPCGLSARSWDCPTARVKNGSGRGSTTSSSEAEGCGSRLLEASPS